MSKGHRGTGGYIGTVGSYSSGGLFNLQSQQQLAGNNSWKLPLVTSGLMLNLDAGNPASYPGSGTTWTDLSGNGRNGTLINGPTFSSSGGGSIVFDGSDDYVSGALPTTAVSSVTLQGWVNVQPGRKGPFFRFGTNGVGYAIGQGASYFNNVGQEVVMLFSGIRWISTGASWDTGWQMVTMILDASGVPSAYKNTTLIGSYSGSNAGAPSGSYVVGRVIGDEPGGGGPWAGNAATFWAYSRVLSPTEISQNFNATRARFGV